MNSAILKQSVEIEKKYIDLCNKDNLQRYELINNEIIAMAPPSGIHSRISGDFFGEIRNHLIASGSSCSYHHEDRGVKFHHNIDGVDYLIPDIVVECDVIDEDYTYNPTLIVEVLSQDRDRDLVDKFKIYTAIESLIDYVVVEQHIMEVRVFNRHNNWEPVCYRKNNSIIVLESIGLKLPIESIYRQIKFDKFGKSYISVNRMIL